MQEIMNRLENQSKEITRQKEEIELLTRRVNALKSVCSSVMSLKGRKVSKPIYSLHPSYQLMRTISYTTEIEDPEVLAEIERKIEVHQENWKNGEYNYEQA